MRAFDVKDSLPTRHALECFEQDHWHEGLTRRRTHRRFCRVLLTRITRLGE